MSMSVVHLPRRSTYIYRHHGSIWSSLAPAHMVLNEAQWIAQLPEDVRMPARTLLDQLTHVAEIIAASLSTRTADETVASLYAARPRVRQVLTEAGQHVNMQDVGELVGERVRLRHGETRAQEVMATFVTLVADRPDDEPTR